MKWFRKMNLENKICIDISIVLGVVGGAADVATYLSKCGGGQ